MSTVQEIQEAVLQLSDQDLTRFQEWFEEYSAKIWDEKFERAAKSGNIDKIAEQAVKDFRSGKYKEL